LGAYESIVNPVIKGQKINGQDSNPEGSFARRAVYVHRQLIKERLLQQKLEYTSSSLEEIHSSSSSWSCGSTSTSSSFFTGVPISSIPTPLSKQTPHAGKLSNRT
jgi:hypothetical protein